MSYSYKYSPVINTIIRMMKEGDPICYTKKTKSAKIRMKKVVGSTFHCLLRYELIAIESGSEELVVYKLTAKGLSFKLLNPITKKIQPNFAEMDLADVLKYKLEESKANLAFHEMQCEEMQAKVKFHQERVAYLSSIINDGQQKKLFNNE